MTWIAAEWREKGGLRRRILEVRRVKGKRKPRIVRYLKPGRNSLKLAVGKHTRLNRLIRSPAFKEHIKDALRLPARFILKVIR